MVQRLYLRHGVDPAQAVGRLEQAIAESGNIVMSASGSDPPTLRDTYLQWVESIEVQLLHFALDPEVVTMFQTPRYWFIRSLEMYSTRPWPLVEAEIAVQVAALQRLVDDLQQRIKRLLAASGDIAVLDTNVLLEYQPPAEVPWIKVVGRQSVRLVVPLRVVEELDLKKYARRGDLAARARRSLQLLGKVVRSGGLPGELRDGVTIEVPVDPGPRWRPTDADEEVLDTCHELQQLTGQDVSLVTADTGMRMRAEARGIRVVRMPPKYERQRRGAGPSE